VLLRNVAKNLNLNPAKFREYALNKNHPRGKHKARVFEAALGYTQDDYDQLLAQIEEKALDSQAKLVREDEYGQHYQVDIVIDGVNGQLATVRTGWTLAPVGATAYLSTLYVLG
jgi:filamentous hemagglutinin